MRTGVKFLLANHVKRPNQRSLLVSKFYSFTPTKFRCDTLSARFLQPQGYITCEFHISLDIVSLSFAYNEVYVSLEINSNNDISAIVELSSDFWRICTTDHLLIIKKHFNNHDFLSLVNYCGRLVKGEIA